MKKPFITPTQHEKNEWSRMAYAAEVKSGALQGISNRYAEAAALPAGAAMEVPYFDALQASYREWLINNVYPTS